MASTDCREESASFGCDKSRAPSGMLCIPVAFGQELWTQGSEQVGICDRGRSMARGTVDGRHRQRPWKGFKVDSNSLQFWGLYAEVFVVTLGAVDYKRRASVRGVVRVY